VLGYYGHRIVQQFLSIPASTQAAPTSAGGVVDLNRQFGGADARWSWKGLLAGQPLSWVVGLSYDRQNELRRGYNNFIGPTLGVQGALRRDENDIVHDVDEYTQGTWDFAPQWSLMVGVRHSDVNFDSENHFMSASNGPGGGVTYQATSPVAGLLFKTVPWLNLYVSFGQGFQTPLGSELAYRPDGAAGLNLGLKPAHSNNIELGTKLLVSPVFTAELAVFQTRTRDEIVVDTNIGGRSTYQNAGRTRRRGVEASYDYVVAPNWRLQFAYTFIEAVYSDAYATCTAVPCPAPTTPVSAGSRLPGVPKNNAYLTVHWGADVGWHASISGQYVSNVAVNDVNSTFTPAYALAGLDGGYGAELSSFKVSAFVRLNNVLNRRYVGSVIVDDGNSRYFEPGPGFNVLGGVSVTFK
jgi:iron complex outermembrane receptor protein